MYHIQFTNKFMFQVNYSNGKLIKIRRRNHTRNSIYSVQHLIPFNQVQRPVKVQIPHPVLVPVPHPYPIHIPVSKPVAVPVVKEVNRFYELY